MTVLMIQLWKGFSLSVPAVMNDVDEMGGGKKTRSLQTNRYERTSDLSKYSRKNLLP